MYKNKESTKRQLSPYPVHSQNLYIISVNRLIGHMIDWLLIYSYIYEISLIFLLPRRLGAGGICKKNLFLPIGWLRVADLRLHVSRVYLPLDFVYLSSLQSWKENTKLINKTSPNLVYLKDISSDIVYGGHSIQSILKMSWMHCQIDCR